MTQHLDTEGSAVGQELTLGETHSYSISLIAASARPPAREAPASWAESWGGAAFQQVRCFPDDAQGLLWERVKTS